MVNIEGYTDFHRTILKTLMTYGTLEEKEFNKIFEKIYQHYYPNEALPTTDEIENVIETINPKISRFDQKIVKYQLGLNQLNYFVFYSTAKTSVSNMQHAYTELELEYFKLLLSQILISEDLSISPLTALNLETNTKLNKTRIEKMLDNWIMNGYFLRENHKIFLGPKSIIEFKEMIQNMELDHLKSCVLCEDVAAWGIACAACKTATYHKNCLKKYLTKAKKCTSCKELWETPVE